MKLNLKTILGVILIFGALSELFRVIGNYRYGVIDFWPFGVEIGVILIVILGIFLIKSGNKR